MLLKQSKKERLLYYVFSTRAEMGAKAAEDIAERILLLLKEKKEVNMIFAAAPSQNEVLSGLAANREIAWNRVNAFHMDEYIGLSQNHPQSFAKFLNNALFDKVNLHSANLIHGDAKDPAAECRRYETLLKNYPADIVCLGIGENGHIAFNDPWVADFEDSSLVKTVPLDEICRRQQVHDGCFASLGQVPKTAVTLTIPALTAAPYLFCTVPSKTKRAAVNAAVNGEISVDCPASVLRRCQNAVLYCDGESGQDLL